ncbi:MAG: flagellin lysine-N-methylase [Clostridia bacterium]|nr:flagellin lysine-N-methylase [Clostridia bacterium]
MQHIFPDYYKDFKCIASRCKYNCCIGWEIDIDDDTAAFYKTVGGDIGKRLCENIANEGTEHFILGENERCPFLNKNNLCDIIIELGEEHICTICQKHPRFENELPGRVETGLGMACEEAARLILSKKTPTRLIGGGESDDEIINLRDEIIVALQNRCDDIDTRVCRMLDMCNTSLPQKNWVEILLGLERLDEKWTEWLVSLRDAKSIDFKGFDRYMADRQTEYEQLLVYLIYRYFANASNMYDAAARAAFAALGYKIIRALGALHFASEGEFTMADQVELCRLFSSEIEYSDENVYILLDELL